MSMIQVDHLTKNYGENRGVFDLSFDTEKGEVYGFLGPNGAGKTTTIRHLLGFSKPQSGKCSIMGFDCWSHAKEIQRHIGYVPGEIAFPDHLTGYEFLEQISDLRKMTTLAKARELIDLFDLDPRGELKRMSKGMKQKIALVTAFMHDPELILLDEPTSGLDPLMQERFVELIKREKESGKTIFMSSHMFDEVEKTCDRVAIIKQGRIITDVMIKDLEHAKDKTFEIKLATTGEMDLLASQKFNFAEVNSEKRRVKVTIHDDEMNRLLRTLSTLNVVYMSEIKFGLEQYFMHYYQREDVSNV
jgi:ABC-2 type transport system ATP-binding protein